ncbi:zonadhesin isoform X2 [Girardinichthys multiradiatus]|uniref:zonadhesin isoform X2 n=1 Tax=Girardinichthys multiradiatus TaxID=208333 RepID=UPI001FADA1FB|nr:zonadhesin isoform X2 [Girardinichthys multiradiatus]
MLGGVHADSLISLLLAFLAYLTTICRAENDLSLVKLPEWKEISDYVAPCFYSQHGNLTCDWTKGRRTAPGDGKVEILESPQLAVTGEACLEFWHLASGSSRAATLRALLKNSLGQEEIWTSLPLPRDAWRQVSVPLNITELGSLVMFEAVHPLAVDQTTLKRIGVRRGSCINQCEANTELWTDNSTRCLCSVGQRFCFSSLCPRDQICGPQKNGPSSSPSGMCTIHSNTYCHTFDGAVFRFMSPCTYVLTKTCSATEALTKFNVEVVNLQSDNAALPTIQQINIDLDNLRVSLLKSQMHWAVVNGVWRELPLSLKNDTIHIKGNPAAVVMGSNAGVSISYDNTGAVQVRIPLQYSDRVCGLCGNFNQLPGDDLLKPDGTKANSATALAKSWQTGENVSSCETIQVPQHCDPLTEFHFSSDKYCGLLRSGSGPFSSCLPVVGAESHFQACLLGLCSNHGDQSVLCETLEVYADVCQMAGIAVPTWRNSTFCAPVCGENSHYNSCANGCPEVCSSLDQPGFCGTCEERCECDPGFKLSGDKCVPADQCGCWYNGKHYKKGGMTVEGDCIQQCQCIGNDVMQCTTMKCASDEVCREKNGVKGCFPFKPATCSVYGDPHYVTFDKLAYNFQGGCAYTLTTTCGGHSTVQFTVNGFNIHPADQTFTRSKLEAVALQLDGLDLTLNQSGKVNVNSDAVRLPYSTSGSYGSVWVYVKNDYTILETTFGLKMEMDGHSRLFLQVDERYKYELCGLCGTYSGYQDDDFAMPGGQIATGSFEFGDSWRLHANEECTAYPNNPRECLADEVTIANEECSMVFQGAFEDCHEHVHPSIYFSSCVYDYCATSGNQATLCESLKSYAAACQVEGVELSHWQTGTPCGFSTTVPTTSSSTSPDQAFCPINCNFDTNMCGWQQLIQDSFDWTRHSGATPSNLTGPHQDHTTGAGFYMYLEGDDASHGDSARILSPSCQLDGPVCFYFWYYMYGSASSMALNIHQLQANKATKIWSAMNNQGPKWSLGKADLNISGTFKFIIEGIRGSTEQSDVAIDDIAITSGSCSVVTALPLGTTEVGPSHPFCNFECSFKNSLCSWSQMVTDAFDWTWNNGSTPTEMTGPSTDHSGDGNYIYIEATSVTHGDTARLISSKCADTGLHCLQFWYHMYGSAETMGLNIYLLQNKVDEAVWQKRNNQGNMWHLAQVELNATTAFQIILEGRRGSNDQSDVAVDDITLYLGRCSDLSGMGTALPINPNFNMTAIPSVNLSTTAAPESPVLYSTAHITKSTVTVSPTNNLTTVSIDIQNITESPGKGQHPECHLDCDFEQDLCQWSQMLTDVFDWERHSGSTPTLTTGPLSDHTTGDGHYLHIEANKASLGDTARFISTECPDTGPQCLEFWYHMYGSADTMGLHIYLLKDKQATVVWRKRNDQGNMWHHAQVALTVNGTFQIIFEGRRGSNDESDVAVDDIRLRRGLCQDLARPTDAQANLSPTNAPLVPVATQLGLSNVTEPQVSPTAGPPPPATQGNATAGPQVPATTQPAPSNATGPPPPATQGNATAGPQVPATTQPAPSNATGPPPPATQGNATAGPQVPATTQPAPSNATGPPPPATQGNATAGPQVPATTQPAPSNATGPPPPATQGNATAGPQVPATTQPAPSNATGPPPPATQGNATAGPQVPATTQPAPSNATGPPPPATQGNATAGPQVPATTQPAPSNATGPPPPATQGNATAGPQVPATTQPVPSNATGPPPPATQGNATDGPQVPATTQPALFNVTGHNSPRTIPENPPSTKSTRPTLWPDLSVAPKRTMSPKQTVLPLPETTQVSTPSCVKNSHYTTCISACSPTCKYLNGPPHCMAQKTCVSGCVCNKGFVQKGSICVPIQHCGCMDGNGTTHHFNELWYTNHCSQKCECEDDDGEGKIDCKDKDGCDGDSVCLQHEMGQYYCKSTGFSECTIQGDPEYQTFDKQKHDFSGTNLYVLVRTKNLPKNLPEIYIEGTNACTDEDSQNDDSSEENTSTIDGEDDKQKLQGLKLKVYNHTVELKHTRKVFVDGQRIEVPGSSAPGLEIRMRSSRIYIKTDFGLSVEFNGNCKTDIILPVLYKRRVEGLCGNFDGRKSNDKQKPDGTLAKNIKEFGESWAV